MCNLISRIRKHKASQHITDYIPALIRLKGAGVFDRTSTTVGGVRVNRGFSCEIKDTKFFVFFDAVLGFYCCHWSQ